MMPMYGEAPDSKEEKETKLRLSVFVYMLDKKGHDTAIETLLEESDKVVKWVLVNPNSSQVGGQYL